MKNPNYELISKGKIIRTDTDKMYLFSLLDKYPDSDVRPQCVSVQPPPVYKSPEITKPVKITVDFNEQPKKKKQYTPRPIKIFEGLTATQLAFKSGYCRSEITKYKHLLTDFMLEGKRFTPEAVKFLLERRKSLTISEIARRTGINRQRVSGYSGLYQFKTIHGYKPEAVDYINNILKRGVI